MARIRIAWRTGEVTANLLDTPTVESKGNECRLASKCNVLGRIEGDPRRLKTVRDGEAIRVELAGN